MYLFIFVSKVLLLWNFFFFVFIFFRKEIFAVEFYEHLSQARFPGQKS